MESDSSLTYAIRGLYLFVQDFQWSYLRPDQFIRSRFLGRNPFHTNTNRKRYSFNLIPVLKVEWMCEQNELCSYGWQIGYDGMRLESQNCGLYGPIVHPRVTAMWTMVWWYQLGLTSNLSTRALWQPPVLSGGHVSRDISGASRRMDEGNKNLVYPSPLDFKRSLTCRKILRHRTSSFASPPEGRCAADFYRP
jgi:hypothetical protein